MTPLPRDRGVWTGASFFAPALSQDCHSLLVPQAAAFASDFSVSGHQQWVAPRSWAIALGDPVLRLLRNGFAGDRDGGGEFVFCRSATGWRLFRSATIFDPKRRGRNA